VTSQQLFSPYPRSPIPTPYSLLLLLHLVEVFEAASADEHQGKQGEVVAGVDQGAGGERPCAEAYPAEHEAYADQQRKRPGRPTRLLAVHQGEWQAAEE